MLAEIMSETIGMGIDSTRHTYVVAGCRPWNRKTFDEKLKKLPGEWHFISKKSELTLEFLKKVSPRYVFFLHWSYIVPEEILNEYECVCFHMTDLPFGRGGTPLQHMILKGLKETKLTAFRMVKELDAGPVYMKAPLSLEGTAEDIYIRAAELSARLIPELIEKQPTPKPQQGKVVAFKRRTPDQSELAGIRDLQQLYDFIRMLDAEDYPRAFLQIGNLRYEFTHARLERGNVTAEVRVTVCEESAHESSGGRSSSRR
jgi:methionyl-tRNA formyltransferase